MKPPAVTELSLAGYGGMGDGEGTLVRQNIDYNNHN